jgi:hypothetical protein
MDVMYAAIVQEAQKQLFAEIKFRSKKHDLSIEEAKDEPKKNIHDFHKAALKSFRGDKVEYIFRCLDIIKIPLKLGHRLDWVINVFRYVEKSWGVKFIHSSTNQNFVYTIIAHTFKDAAGHRFRRGMYKNSGFKFYERMERGLAEPFGKGVNFTHKPHDVQVDGMLVRGHIVTPELASAAVESREGAGRPGSASTKVKSREEEGKHTTAFQAGDDRTQIFEAVSPSQSNNGRGTHTGHRLGTAPPYKDLQSTQDKVAADQAKNCQGHPQAKSNGGTSVCLRPGAFRGPRPKLDEMSTEKQSTFLEDVDKFTQDVRDDEEAEAAAKGGGGDDENQSHVQV